MSGIGKDIIVRDLMERLERAETTIITDYQGLKVKEMAQLRKQLREAKIEYKVAKNTLACLAAQESQLKELEQFLVGPTAFAFGEGDPTNTAKLLTNFSREYPLLKIRGGTFEKEILSSEQINLWATLPSRDELLAKVAAGMKNPLSNLVFGLKGIIAKFIYTLEAIKKQKNQ
ncbi:50S ribosomal protein L10 [candidate division NPL-UPA2 bacterium]|nr:50S ribosomal protein L10 [candidate division NPL-UPA2 bacterium]